MTALSNFLKISAKKPEIYPIVGILTFALSGAAYFGARAMRAPDVVWNSKSNPHPWQEIKDGEQVKLIALNQKYDNRWQRKNW
ncbi:NADH-ubiquinone reductase complex 1 MLRQ subunit-domain-containing protein [Cokeromyces recurvatus]|uniref:NADH-ubiquinone reductase complex 1 MLRQ subunit-domain-containing protein n=1 Tax=Cokeromyces recurvatus TaxID=90255 RepID=UPI002220282A|nr:NADH-ubiquinone reductase complex 1 MLRQ subunit-domain-containing protein [Cokeromyces recurvatus]KAI7898710.1 NADH-ubiquinone reductase complex 1 MLRQ subunit-domain-containing protein [Cokeromyces recurvatus]